MSFDVPTEQPTSAEDSRYEQQVRQAAQQFADLEAQMEVAVKSIIESIHPDALPDLLAQIPMIVPQIPTLRYPNLPTAGNLIDTLSRDLDRLGRAQDAAEEDKISERLDATLGKIAAKLTTAEIKQSIRTTLYVALLQNDPNSLVAAVLSVALMSLETMEPGDNAMLKQMVLQTLQDTTQQLAQLQEMMANIPPASEVKPSTRLLIRLGEGMARQLGRTAYLVNFLNLPNVLPPARELENDATRLFEMTQKMRAEGREQPNDEEKQEQQKMMETTINLRFTEARITGVINELQSLAAWAQQSDPQRFRDLIDLANFAASSFNMVQPGEHPILQSLYALAINSLVNDLMMLNAEEQTQGGADSETRPAEEQQS
jgi:hypothetical protein